ncbi:hypothetical protein A6R71_02920 [Xanthomonas translucens pv. arrhenatheri]|uniref:Secreted protein n=1 Tax=Xanthomonas graminis pv. arrhenatheri LMG 727 TaxID=1195923 RepID=A0A0K2ZL20_9XANT|nr:hypothetical protein [Xanthomonas translucens]OAX67513.1 hypothetical protein A6R71_02920 [Xanthomonas translucens pv. arrhenatheri]UKE77886.1 hypothetical protein KM317_01110 [Xanthomonas translucens pv. arrhenatheri]CTP86471.1 hypothetical protein XTALMG727_1691 [Xanthomonas translucens pv. arrhenatheri LMG 727]
MKTASFALTFAIAALLAAPAIAALTIPTLDSVQVRPSAEQIAQRSVERNSGIATLTAVQVRPSAEQIAQRATEQATSQRVVTLAAVQVRPSADTQSVFAIGSVVSGALDSAMLQPSLQNLGQDLTTSLAR